MDKKTTIILLGLVVVVFGISIGVFAMSGSAKTDDACKDVTGKSLNVTIKESNPSSADVKAKLCDTLTFISNDKVTREIGFGVHDKHVSYDGISEKVLNKGQSFSVTLNKAGTFHWHDHYHDEVEGYFTVTK